MYDVEMMQMLRLIHLENQYIFEILRLGLLCEEERKRSVAVYVDHGIRERDELDKEIALNRKNTKKRHQINWHRY